MQYISLNNSSLSYFTSKGELSELSGSSSWQVSDGLLFEKVKSKPKGIENETAIQDYLTSVLSDNLAEGAKERIFEQLVYWRELNKSHKFTSERELTILDYYEDLAAKFVSTNAEFPFKYAKICAGIAQNQSRYQHVKRLKKSDRVINKSKAKGKMFALFNLKRSSKFIAFYSVSFPLGCSDDVAFDLWNYWLTYCRKKWGLNNYVWVTERQKNKTIHFHMLTNNWLPISQVNRAMAIIINNAVSRGELSWGNSSINRYNGVDVDSIYNSKRHKKTGKQFNPAQLRNWVTKYITKYVTKNSEKFNHLCWHCSRSVSALFTSTLLLLQDSRLITDFLPKIADMYIKFKSDFNTTYIFKFVPPPKLFEKIRAFNDLVFEKYVVQHKNEFNSINFQTKTL